MDASALSVTIITPIYNDFAAFTALCRDLGITAPACGIRLSVLAVDDGSVISAMPDHVPSGIERIEVLRLMCNLGHQRAIAVGLAEAAQRRDYDVVVVMDCDGEDRPSDLVSLLDAHRRSPSAIIAARRARRSEGVRFRLFYGLYKSIFAIGTGRTIDFGNFMVVPAAEVKRLAHMPEVWNHLAAAVLRSPVRIERVACNRGTRYAGRSSMNLVTLLAHGLSAVAVFSDLVFVRLLVLASTICGLAFFVAAAAIAIRATTDLAIPGWASNVVGISAIMLFQALTLSVVACLTMLASRSAAVFIPAIHARQYVAEQITLMKTCSA
jgi:polyisoprenyl-phosphate glycosyltransferase